MRVCVCVHAYMRVTECERDLRLESHEFDYSN